MSGFWRREVIDPALGEDTERKIADQKQWIAAEPANARPYYHLAQLYRIQARRQEALGLLLEAVRLDPQLAGAHLALAEIYAVLGDYAAAWRHARRAEEGGRSQAVEMLERHGVAEA
jgi:tetratricopeptide (TPR) repeat protein